MAMFNFELGGQETKKPMRSYIDFDASGRPKARIFVDEYDAARAHPDFQRFIYGAGKNMEDAQSAFSNEINEAKLGVIEKRINQKKQEAINAELSAQEAGPENKYPGLDIWGRMTGGQTFEQIAKSKQDELRKLIEQRAALTGSPEISARSDAGEVGSAIPDETTDIEPVITPEQPKSMVRVKNPNGVIANVPADVWSANAKKYIEQGYQLMP